MSARIGWVLAFLLAPWAARAEDAFDRDARDPLKPRVPAVSGAFFSKAGLLEAQPSAAISVQDAFFRKYVFGLEVARHFTDTLSVNGRGAYAVSEVATTIHLCAPPTGPGAPLDCRSPTRRDLEGHAPGDIAFLVSGGAQWAPVYGKLGLAAEAFARFDLYLTGGAALVGYRGPSDGGGSSLRLSAGGYAGLGSRWVLLRWLALRAEVTDLVYPEVYRLGSAQVSAVRTQLFAQVGVSFFL
jgi:outer membrane beta-barrel protein